MIYKPGDKVKVRPDLTNGRIYGAFGAVESMEKFAGTVVTIKEIEDYDNTYTIAEDPLELYWTAEMFDSVPISKYHVTETERAALISTSDSFFDLLTAQEAV